MRNLCLLVVFLAACSGTGREAVGPDGAGDGRGLTQDASGTEDATPDALADRRLAPEDSVVPPPDAAEETPRGTDLSEEPAPSDVEGSDTPAPSDVEGSDLADLSEEPAPSDVEGSDLAPLPAGCCYTDSDCPVDGSGEQACAGQALGWPEGAGVCKGKPSDPGRCYGDVHCPAGSHCDGESVCGCMVDCDMDYEGPGICVPDDGTCPAVDTDWVMEYCNAANLVVFDGKKCVATCPGCCECKPFCKYTFQSFEECEASCLATTPQCPLYVAALATEPYSVWQPDQGCESIDPAPGCSQDSDCPPPFIMPDPGASGDLCVLGNCVFCWNDSQCKAGELCRAGRCVPNWTGGCPEAPLCKLEDGCRLITPSEKPCPICICDSTYSIECYTDEFCMIFSFHPFSRCVYGRCADCRNDSDCPAPWSMGTTCIPPGICYDMTPPPASLYGTWLVGWYGGLDHFSYFRFEMDGTLRRGHYVIQDTFMDDFPGLPCYPGEDVTYPLLGTWEPEITQSGFLVVRVNLNVSCDPKAGYTARWAFTPSADGQSADVKDIDTGNTFLALRYPTTVCLPDMSLCEAPQYPF